MAVRVVLVLSFVTCVLSQAPGDGEPICVQEVIDGLANPFFALHPAYPANERPLMDSRDYTGLLQAGNPPVWQHVDNDNNNTITDVTNWIQQTVTTCRGTVQVCGFGEGAQENWLITQHISRELAGGQRLQKVTARFDFQLNGCDVSRQCRQSFDVYKWQTSTINREAARNTGNYVRVGRISPADTSGTVVTSETLDVELTAESGFYMAVVDLSTCILIERILVFYYVCPAETSELTIRPETISPVSQVNGGECVENSSPQTGSNPVLRCADEGVWDVIIPCQCDPGYEGMTEEDTFVRCSECSVGTYSEGLGNEECVVCPPNSEATQTGLTQCTCIPGYYRAPDEGPSVACTQSPSAPLSVNVSNVTNTSVILSWLPPENGGGRDLSEIHYTITARDTDGGGTTVVVRDVMGTEGQVEGLTPGALYTLSVTAENAVSSQDSDINARTTNATAITEDGVAGTVSDIPEPDSGITVVSWSPPVPPNGVILYYNVRISHVDTGELILLVIELYDTEIDLDEHNVPDGMVTVEVQAVTSVGAGNFSSPVTVVVGQSSGTSSSMVSVIVGVVIGVIILLLGVVACLLLLYIFWYRNQVKRKNITLYHGIELPTTGHRMYVDPTTYSHVERAVEDFAKEIAPKSIRLTEEIGNGEFGNVYRGIWRTDSKEQLPIAVKTLKPGSSPKMRSDFLTEASIMGQFDNPNVITLYGVVTLVEPAMIVMEFMENGSLYYYLRKNDEQFKSTRLVKMALGVAKGMNYLSEVGYVHRDLAARNVLVDRDETTKVADFGLSREVVEDEYKVTKGGKIPVRWTAPEAIAYRKFTSSSDVWSFGVLLWEVMSYCQQPYEDWDNQTVLDKLDAGHRLHKPKDCPDSVYKSMLECWNADRNKRPTFSQVVRILEILLEGDLTEGPKPKPRTKKTPSSQRLVSSPLDHTTVAEWLESIKMTKYAEHFQESGRTSIEKCLNLTADDLNRMGITLAGHQNKIITSIRAGRDQLDRQQSVRI